MRKISLLPAFLCLGLIAAAQNAEEENIKAAINGEVEAYSSRDMDKWKTHWVHNANVSNNFFSKDGFTITKGWDSLEARINRNFKANATSPSTFSASNFMIHAEGNMARAEYDVTQTPAKDESAIFPYNGVTHYHNYVVLVKDGGQWKTVSRVITIPESYSPNEHSAEIAMNNAGYELLAAKKMKEAIEVFEMNVKLFPNSWNTWDSLGEAYAAAGDKKKAIDNYEKSVKLNPASESGKAALAKLKQ